MGHFFEEKIVIEKFYEKYIFLLRKGLELFSFVNIWQQRQRKLSQN